MVIKRGGERELFDRDKIVNGMLRACEKRPISVDVINNVAREIENHLSSGLKREVSTKEIGELVMEHLKDIDEIAYVRFASVYREFKDAQSFMDELANFLKKDAHNNEANDIDETDRQSNRSDPT